MPVIGTYSRRAALALAIGCSLAATSFAQTAAPKPAAPAAKPAAQAPAPSAPRNHDHRRTWTEEIEIRGEELIDSLNRLAAEGKVRRIRLVEPDGDIILDMPLTIGAIAGGAVVLAAPLLAQNGDRAGEVQAPPPASMVIPPAPALSAAEALKGDLSNTVRQLEQDRVPFVIATVVRARRPTSVRPGDSADCVVIDPGEEPERVVDALRELGVRCAAILVTHAHLDHCGRLPLLYRRGFRGEIITTSASRDLTRLVLLDSAHLQEAEARRREKHWHRHTHRPHSDSEPTPALYTTDDVEQCLKQIGRAHV